MTKRKNCKAKTPKAALDKVFGASSRRMSAEELAECRRSVIGKEVTPTAQRVAAVFTDYTKQIMELCNRFAYRQDDRELAKEYNNNRYLVGKWCDHTKEYLPDGPVLPDLPELVDNDYFAAMLRLSTFCTKAAKRLCTAPTAAPKTRKSDTINGYIFEALQALPDAEKRRYQKGRKIYALVKEQHPTFDRAYRTFENYLAKLAKAEKIESNTGQKDAGYRLPQK